MAKANVGGQAVIEGVMMRNKSRVGVAVRNENGKVVTKKYRLRPLSNKFKVLKWPFIRGTYNLFSMMAIGIRALTWSSNAVISKKEEKLTKKDIAITIITSILFSIIIFVFLPLFLTNQVTTDQGLFHNLIDGLFRVGVFIGYILIISLFDDVRRVFKYHGAEHKVAYCYESGKTLNVKNAKEFSRLHPRCGTNFIVMVLLVMVFVHTLIMSDSFWIKLASRVVLLPVIAGISFELLVLTSKFDNVITKSLAQVGFLFQRLTTKEPDDKMIAVAIKSIKLVVDK